MGINSLGTGPIKDAPFSVKISAGERDDSKWDLAWEDAQVVAGEEKKFTARAKDNQGNFLTTGGANLTGKLTGPTSPAVSVADNGDGSYEVKYLIEKTGDYKIALAAGSHNLGEKNVTCVPSTFSGANSVASGPGIKDAKIGILKKETK